MWAKESPILLPSKLYDKTLVCAFNVPAPITKRIIVRNRSKEKYFFINPPLRIDYEDTVIILLESFSLILK
jgi:hypothetical protein